MSKKNKTPNIPQTDTAQTEVTLTEDTQAGVAQIEAAQVGTPQLEATQEVADASLAGGDALKEENSITPSMNPDKKFGITRFVLIAIFVVLILVGAFFGYKKYEFSQLAPTVVAGNFSLEYRKVPYNVPSIDFIFSHNIDPSTVTSDSLKMYPFVKGAPTVKNGNTISYALQEPLKIGTKYLIELSPTIASVNGVAFGKTVSYEIEAIGGVKVSKMIPEGVTTGLSKNPLFIFNIPVVPLTNLSNRDSLPCPVVFEPAIKGRCTWPSSNILEYKLDAPLNAATRYKVSIVLGTEFLYPLETPFEASFETTPLWRMQAGQQYFSPKNGIEVVFSAPVRISDLEKHLSVYSKNDTLSGASLDQKALTQVGIALLNPVSGPAVPQIEVPENMNDGGTPQPQKLPSSDRKDLEQALNNLSNSTKSDGQKKAGDTSSQGGDLLDVIANSLIGGFNTKESVIFKNAEGKQLSGDVVVSKVFISGATGPFDFSKEFLVSITKGLSSAYGNLPQVRDDAFKIQSQAFVTGTEYYQPYYSETGAVAGFEYVSGGFLPTNKPSIQLQLDDDLDVSKLSTEGKNAIYLQSAKGEKVPCTLSNPMGMYPESEGSMKYVEKPNTRTLKCSVEQVLPVNTEYTITIDTPAYAGLKSAWKIPVNTPPEFVINSVKPASATELCVYSSTPIGRSATGITVTPNARIKEVSSYTRFNDDGTRVCPDVDGLVASTIDIRLIGEMEYSMSFDTVFKDMYQNSLTKNYTTQFTSPKLKRRDGYLFFMPEKEYQTIPSSAAVRLPVQSVNASKIFVEVCAISPSELAQYQRENYRYVPACSGSPIRKELSIKNRNWDVTSTQIDLSEGFFENNQYPGDILFVRGSLDQGEWTHSWPEQRDFKVVYIRSNIALGIVSGQEKSVVFATTYDGKATPSDLVFSYHGCMRGAPVELPKWNGAKSYYELSTNFSGADGCILQATGRDGSGYVSTYADATSNYDFGQVGGVESSTRDFAFTYTDRPMYRAGDTVYFKGIVREFLPTGYKKTTTKKVKVRILHDDWSEVAVIETTVNQNGNFSGEFTLPAKMKTGRHFFELVNAETSSFIVNDAVFIVEQYSKPVFKTETKNASVHAVMGDKVSATAKASYYFGGALPEATVRWTVRSQNYFFDPKNYSQYRFGTSSEIMDCIYWNSCSTHDEVLADSFSRLDTSGVAAYEYLPVFEFPKQESEGGVSKYDVEFPREKIVSVTAEVTDPDTGKTVQSTDSTIIHSADGYVGISTPYWTNKGEPIKTSGVVLTYDAQPKANAEIQVEFIKTEWVTANKTGVDGYSYGDYTLKKTLAHSTSTQSNEAGLWFAEWTPGEGGEYIIRATYKGKDGKTFVSEDYSYVSTETYSLWNNGNASVTEMVAEKALYKPGETASFTLKTPVNSGKILITVEKDDAILDSFVQDISSFAERIQVPVKKEYLPNVYIRAYVIGADTAKGLPVYKRALSQLRVSTGDQQLSVQVSAKKPKYQPGEGLEVEVTVLDSAGKPVANANGSLAVVDQSVLALAGNPKKNPFVFFYEMKRYLGTTFFSSLVYLVDKIEVKNTANGEKGGAGEGNKGGDTKKKRGIFKDTAFWQAEFATNAEGKATINTGKLPDNLTTWEIEAIVSTADTRVGRGETTITTRKPVMISENLPRFLRTGDSMEIAPVVFNQSGKKQVFSVQVSGTGVVVHGNSSMTKTVTLEDGASAPVSFEVTAKEFDSKKIQAAATIDISVTSSDSDGDAVTRVLPVMRSEVFETVSDVGVAEGNALPRKLDLTGIEKNRSEIIFQASATLFGQTVDGIEHLLTYPYGCVEQITSAIIPHVAVKKIHDSLSIPFDLKEKTIEKYVPDQGMVKVSIQSVLMEYVIKVMTYEHPSGGLTYWPYGDGGYMSTSDFRMTAYVLKTLKGVSDIGISVDTGFVNRNIAYLKNRYVIGTREGCRGEKNICEYTKQEKLAALEAIALWSKNGEDVRQFLSAMDKNDWTLTEKIGYLSVQSALIKNSQLQDGIKDGIRKESEEMIAEILKTKLVYDPRGAYISPEGSMGRLQATAEIVRFASIFVSKDATVAQANDQLVDNMVRFLSREKKSDGSYGSTRDTAYVLESFAARMTALGIGKSFEGSIVLNGKEAMKQSFGTGNILDVVTARQTLQGFSDTTEYLAQTIGGGKMYYSASLVTPIAASKTPARDEGFFVATEYYDYTAYMAIRKKKEEEWAKYMNGEIAYDALQYPKEVTEYVSSVPGGKIGQLLWVEYRIIVAEHRDSVAFESFVPAGTELVNTHLATETKTVSADTFFDREEFLDDRYFGFAQRMNPGEYRGGYAIRLTQSGRFEIPASKAFEFYTPEVFGQTAGKVLQVRK